LAIEDFGLIGGSSSLRWDQKFSVIEYPQSLSSVPTSDNAGRYPLLSAQNAVGNPTLVTVAATSRDLQLGRLLFGVTYRATERSTINWSVEVGATRDATDLRRSLRIPIEPITGRAR
jgi:hypothetical protein